MAKRIIAGVVLAVALAALLAYSQQVQEPLMVSGFLESDEIRIGSRVGGRVSKVHVDEGTDVSAGQVLVELEPFDLLDRLAQSQAEQAARQAEFDRLSTGFRAEEKAQAQARVDQLAAQLKKLQNGPRQQTIAAAQARVRLAKSQLELAQTNHKRTAELVASKTFGQEELDRAVTELAVADQTLRVRTEELNELLAGTRPEEIEQAQAQLEEARQAWLLASTGYRDEQIAEAKAALDAAKAAVRVIEDQRAELTITAPSNSVVEALDLQPGDLVPAGAPVISLADKSRLWVRAYVPENRLALELGQQVKVTVDSFADREFRGHVSFIARQAEFRPGNVQTPEERSKQVFRIKVTLDEGLDVLRPGMVADVWLEGP